MMAIYRDEKFCEMTRFLIRPIIKPLIKSFSLYQIKFCRLKLMMKSILLNQSLVEICKLQLQYLQR